MDDKRTNYLKPTTTMYKPTRNGKLYYASPLMALHTWPGIVHKFTVDEFRRIAPWTYEASREIYLGTLTPNQIFSHLNQIEVKRLLADLAIMRSDISLVKSLVATTVQTGTHRANLVRATSLGMLNFYLVIYNRAFDGKSIPELWFPGLNDEKVTKFDDVFTRHIARSIRLINPHIEKPALEKLPWATIRARVNGQMIYRRYDLQTGLFDGGIKFRKGLDPYPHQLRMPYFAPVEYATEGSWDDHVMDLAVDTSVNSSY